MTGLHELGLAAAARAIRNADVSTPGRWPSDGVAPISHVLDAIGLLARNVEDCELLDSVLTGGAVSASDQRGDLKDVRFAYAPRQRSGRSRTLGN